MNVTIQLNEITNEITRIEAEIKDLDDLYSHHTNHFEKQILIERIAWKQGQLNVWRELKFRQMAAA